MHKGSLWGVVGVMALVAGVGYYYFDHSKESGLASAPGVAKAAEKIITVEAEPATLGTIVDDLRAVGTLQANESVVISPEISGRINHIRFKEGEQVQAGDILVQLDADILSAELHKVQADLNLTEANLQRANTLAKQGTGTLRARDEAVAARQAAGANLTLAKARLEKTSIVAPFSGVVGLRSVSLGAYVTPGDRLVELSDIASIKVDFRVSELALSSVKPDQLIRVAVDAIPRRFFEGRIYAIDPIVDANGRAIRLRAQIKNSDRSLFPGLFARVQILIERRENSILVPESALFARGEKRFVYQVIDKRAVLKEVVIGQRQEGRVEILQGLSADKMVITAGHGQVREGAKVDVVQNEVAS